MEEVHDCIVVEVSFLVAVYPEEVGPAVIHTASKEVSDGEGLSTNLPNLVGKLIFELVLEAGLESFEGCQRFAPGIHLDVQIV